MENITNKIKLLLVDDEEEFLISTKKALDRRNIDVTTARNGEEALRTCKSRKFDIAVLDVKMPGIDGVELFYKMKTEIPGIPIIILTGHGTIAQAFRTSKDGIFDFQAKPCDIDVLTKKIKEAVKNRSVEENDFYSAIRLLSKSDIRLLIINDEKECIETVGKTLKNRNMKVHFSESDTKATEFLKQNAADVIILDLSLCRDNGIDLLQQLKSGYQNVEVILMAEYSQAEIALKGVKLGAWDYFIKPVDLKQITWSIIKAYKNRLDELEKERKKTVDEILDRFPD